MRRPAVTVKLETGYSYFSSSKCSSHTIAYGKAPDTTVMIKIDGTVKENVNEKIFSFHLREIIEELNEMLK